REMKKHLLLLALFGVLAIGLTGCLGVPQEEVVQDDATTMTDEPAVVDEPEVMEEDMTVAEMIEDFDSYVESDVDPLLECAPTSEEALEFIAGATEDGIKELKLMDTTNYRMTLYLTANPDKVDTEAFKKVISDGACSELGTNDPLKAYDDYLLWGHSMCTSGGPAPSEDAPDYKDFQKCLELQTEVAEYFKGEEHMDDEDDDDIAAFECPEEGATVDCEPLIGEGGAEKAAYCEWVEENCTGMVLAL
ncbi:hypothetical protein ACFL3C_05125, partial [Patescibacteria group bacterium]